MIQRRAEILNDVLPELTDVESNEVARILDLLPEPDQRHLIENLLYVVDIRRCKNGYGVGLHNKRKVKTNGPINFM